MARCGPKPKLSPFFSASKSYAQLGDTWGGSEGLSVYSLSGRDTPRVTCPQILPSRGLVCPEKAKHCALACVGLTALPAPLAVPLRTRWFMSRPNEGLVCSCSVLSIAGFPGLWGLQRLTSLCAGPVYISQSPTHTEISSVRFRPNHFRFITLNWSVCSVCKQACLTCLFGETIFFWWVCSSPDTAASWHKTGS